MEGRRKKLSPIGDFLPGTDGIFSIESKKGSLRFLFDHFNTFVVTAVAANLMRSFQLTALCAF
jgi:hypothetical protein